MDGGGVGLRSGSGMTSSGYSPLGQTYNRQDAYAGGSSAHTGSSSPRHTAAGDGSGSSHYGSRAFIHDSSGQSAEHDYTIIEHQSITMTKDAPFTQSYTKQYTGTHTEPLTQPHAEPFIDEQKSSIDYAAQRRGHSTGGGGARPSPTVAGALETYGPPAVLAALACLLLYLLARCVLLCAARCRRRRAAPAAASRPTPAPPAQPVAVKVHAVPVDRPSEPPCYADAIRAYYERAAASPSSPA